MDRDELLAKLRSSLVGRDDVRLALLFGSRARAIFRPDSDVDVAVDGTALDLLALAATLSEALEMEVDVMSLDDPGVPLLEVLVRESVVVHEASRGAAATWRSRVLTTLETDRPWFARMRDAWLRRIAERGVGHGR